MKTPDLKALGEVQTAHDPFRAAAETAQVEADEIKKKSYTLMQAHIDYINTLAKEMAQAENSPIISASAAVRRIIDEHRRIGE